MLLEKYIKSGKWYSLVALIAGNEFVFWAFKKVFENFFLLINYSFVIN